MSTQDSPVELFGLRIAHIGINTDSPAEADEVAGLFESLMGLEVRHIAPISTFAGTLVEVMNNGGRGEKGHIGFHVDDLDAAVRWFGERGFAVDESTRTTLPTGDHLVYFTRPIAGFAIHLTDSE